MRRPRAGDRLPGDLEGVNELRPRPHRGALARLRRVLDELVQPRIVPAVTVGLDGHAAISRRRRVCATTMAPGGYLRWSYRVAHLTCPQHPNKLMLNPEPWFLDVPGQ